MSNFSPSLSRLMELGQSQINPEAPRNVGVPPASSSGVPPPVRNHHHQPPSTWLVNLLLILLSAGCGVSKSKPPTELSIYFTCDTRGRLEPCGCYQGQFGGITRLKTVLDSDTNTPALRVDVGDAIGGREDYDLLEYRYVLNAFAAMQYDALNLGHREAKLSASQLRELVKTSPVPLISANLLDQATGEPLASPWRIIDRAGYRIALVGILDPHGLETDLGPGLAVGDLESTLARLVPKLKGQADLIMLLAFTDEATLTRLAQQFFEVQVILGGKVRQPAQELQRENRSLVYFVTNESRALGLLRLHLDGQPLPRVMHHEIRLLHDRIPQDPSLRQLVKAYREEVRRIPLALDQTNYAAADMVPGVRMTASYVGSSNCVACHVTAGAVWAKTAHARAFATLTARQADADPKCIGCHTTGFGLFSGYRREYGRTNLVDVSCESCHGPGSLHLRQQQGDHTINFTFRPLGAGDCQKCHYGEFSRPFNYDEFWPLIRHGKDDAAAARVKTSTR